ncbi:Nuclear pore complex protein [Vanrija pseudolonga]|uniref:Nuclear pore complex protein n=1 Tax=Vanrija pseudolonga TaxID=143232 RepID=A0AAF0YDV2_9TREE|nr:Nuclear pore complex protein [Vanrija pseudolonga]WOO81999.1 Nuclear pore complex protein [Vanrija pseudolonga]
MEVATTNQGGTPYTEFASTLASYHAKYAEAGPSKSQLDSPIPYDDVLDESRGMIRELMESLKQNVQTLHSNGGPVSDEEEALLLEHRTWALIRAVYENRIQRADPEFEAPSAAEQIRASPYTTPEALAQTIVNESSDLSLWATLVDHLQTRPLLSEPKPIEGRSGYLPFTVRKAKSARFGAGSTPASLDPDFTLRAPQGQGLAGEDQTYQAPLLEVLWDRVRHGELDDAVSVCEQGGEPWRAASLIGGRRWSVGGLTKDSLPVSALQGNRARALWKKSCRAIAKNPTLSSAERSLYAALISDLPTLLPACTTWEDQLWAYIQARLENRIDRRAQELGGFWQEEDISIGVDDEESGGSASDSIEDVFARIAAVQTGDIAAASQSPYIAVQRYVILGRTNDLLVNFADRLATIQNSVPPDQVGPLVRFFAHLVLVLRSLGQPVSETAANAIIEAYLSVLEDRGNDTLVAMYAACLREGNGEESYARFLRSMDPNATRQQKQEALLRAKQYNLDVAIIAKETVRLILEDAFAFIPSLSTDQPDITSFSASLTERDVQLIRSIEWLTMVPETLAEALVRSNDVARYFLALGQANAAQALLKTLPDFGALDAEADAGHDGQLVEHTDYRKLLATFAVHDLIEEVQSRAPKATTSKVEQLNWRKRLFQVIDQVNGETRDLLISDWLNFPIQSRSTYSTQRRKELRRIRQIFIPDLVLRLHAQLMDNRALFPQLLQTALEMTKLVADEEHKVYVEFLGQDNKPYRLVAYLDRVRESSMAALQGGSSNPIVAAVAN